jgi:hypothetical protein
LHALISATEATSGTSAVAAAKLRPLADLSMERAYPDDDAGRNDPRRSGISRLSPIMWRDQPTVVSTVLRQVGDSYFEGRSAEPGLRVFLSVKFSPVVAPQVPLDVIEVWGS